MNQLSAEQRRTNQVDHKIDTPSSQPRIPVRWEPLANGPGQSGRLAHQCAPTRMPSGSLGVEIALGIPFLGASMGVNAAHTTVRCHERGCSPSPSYRRPTRSLPADQQHRVRTTGHTYAAVLQRAHSTRVRNDPEVDW